MWCCWRLAGAATYAVFSPAGGGGTERVYIWACRGSGHAAVHTLVVDTGRATQVGTYLQRTASPRAIAPPASTRPPPHLLSSLSSSSRSCQHGPACRMSRRMKDPWACSRRMTPAPAPAATPRTDTLPSPSPPCLPSAPSRRRRHHSQTHHTSLLQGHGSRQRVTPSFASALLSGPRCVRLHRAGGGAG